MTLLNRAKHSGSAEKVLMFPTILMLRQRCNRFPVALSIIPSMIVINLDATLENHVVPLIVLCYRKWGFED